MHLAVSSDSKPYLTTLGARAQGLSHLECSPPHYLVLDFAAGQSVYDLAVLQDRQVTTHPSVAAARQLRAEGPPPVSLLSCLEVRPVL